MITVENSRIDGPLVHVCVAYSGDDEYLNRIVPFLQQAQAAAEPALMLAPTAQLDLVRRALHSAVTGIAFLDASVVARNPARIIPLTRRFVEVQQGRTVRIVGEALWPGRSAAEIREFVRHEALVNVLIADVHATFMCPYDASALADSVVADVTSAHAHALCDGGYGNNPAYVDPTVVLAQEGRLPPAPDDAYRLSFFRPADVGAIRRLVGDHARQHGLDRQRAQDLALAVDEAVSNTVAYSQGGGTLRVWVEAGSLVCEVCDTGHITLADFAGRLCPPATAVGGRGLWIMHQICDLVELDSTPAGTTVRLHMSIK